MERYELRENDRLAALIDAAERGDEAVITRNGEVVAELRSSSRSTRRDGSVAIDPIALNTLRAKLKLVPASGVEIVRTLRDKRDW